MRNKNKYTFNLIVISPSVDKKSPPPLSTSDSLSLVLATERKCSLSLRPSPPLTGGWEEKWEKGERGSPLFVLCSLPPSFPLGLQSGSAG